MWRHCARCPTTSTRSTGSPPATATAFARYWTEREQLVEHLAAIVGDGVTSGELRPVDPRLTALTLMSNDEGTQNWLRVGGRDGAPVHAGGAEHHAVGSFLADLTVRGLLAAPAISTASGGTPMRSTPRLSSPDPN